MSLAITSSSNELVKFATARLALKMNSDSLTGEQMRSVIFSVESMILRLASSTIAKVAISREEQISVLLRRWWPESYAICKSTSLEFLCLSAEVKRVSSSDASLSVVTCRCSSPSELRQALISSMDISSDGSVILCLSISFNQRSLNG